MVRVAPNKNISLVVTSIAEPNEALSALARGCRERSIEFIVIGDRKSPRNFYIEGCRYISLEEQLDTGFRYAASCPTGHYARKNIGYLYAIRAASECIIETDDDNFPRDGFWETRQRDETAVAVCRRGWVNILKYFTDATIWPRGFPLQEIKGNPPPLTSLPRQLVPCPIQQGLVDNDPDVDAIYRLTLPLSIPFHADRKVALGPGAWCPFNSQNTRWWPEAYPLLYLPAHVPFRMTDIWRSFIAQRIAWEYGWYILFRSADVAQIRNDHDLIQDFENEIPGYLHNFEFTELLSDLNLSAAPADIGNNLRTCYEALVSRSLIPRKELELVDAWLSDLAALGRC